MNRAFRIARFVLVQLLVLLVLLEVGLRVARPFNDNVRILLYQPAIVTGYDDVRTLPDLLGRTILGYGPCEEFAGFIRNSRGFRTPEYSAAKAPGRLRLLVLGDSFSAECGGIPFQDMWHTIVGRDLAASRPGGVEVISLGVPGVGPMFERRMWQIEGSRLNPDAVLLQLFVGNDFTDEYELDLRPDAGAVLSRASYAFRFLRNASRALAARRNRELQDVRVGAAAATDAAGNRVGGYELPEYREMSKHRKPYMSRERLLRIESQRLRLCEKAQQAGFRELLGRVTSIVGALHDEVSAAGIPFRVVVIPDRFQVNPAEREEMLRFLRMTEDEFTAWDMPQRELGAFLDREGIPWLDLLPAFREAARTDTLYFPDDIHWNVRGNAVGGAAIAAWLGPGLAEGPGAPRAP